MLSFRRCAANIAEWGEPWQTVKGHADRTIFFLRSSSELSSFASWQPCVVHVALFTAPTDDRVGAGGPEAVGAAVVGQGAAEVVGPEEAEAVFQGVGAGPEAVARAGVGERNRN